MEKIASFTVDHIKLLTGLYVSRIDNVNGNSITTFDMRVTKPNVEEVMDTASIHAYEHLGATFLRNHKEMQDKVIYFGPMGCRTGFYIILSGLYESKDVVWLVNEMNEFVLTFEGIVPGQSPKDCGNYLDIDLEGAKKFARKYKNEFLSNPVKERLEYPN